jgi:hypothetical protein
MAFTVHEIAGFVEEEAYEYGENPLDLDLTLCLNSKGWWIDMGMDYPYTWPSGMPSVVLWNGEPVAADDAKGQQAMQADFRRSLAYHRQRRVPSWTDLELQQQDILDEVKAFGTTAGNAGCARLAQALEDFHGCLAHHFADIQSALERERDITAAGQGINRYAD